MESQSPIMKIFGVSTEGISRRHNKKKKGKKRRGIYYSPLGIVMG